MEVLEGADNEDAELPVLDKFILNNLYLVDVTVSILRQSQVSPFILKMSLLRALSLQNAVKRIMSMSLPETSLILASLPS